jgi:hypothetical protein
MVSNAYPVFRPCGNRVTPCISRHKSGKPPAHVFPRTWASLTPPICLKQTTQDVYTQLSDIQEQALAP